MNIPLYRKHTTAFLLSFLTPLTPSTKCMQIFRGFQSFWKFQICWTLRVGVSYQFHLDNKYFSKIILFLRCLQGPYIKTYQVCLTNSTFDLEMKDAKSKNNFENEVICYNQMRQFGNWLQLTFHSTLLSLLMEKNTRKAKQKEHIW